jgi:hypothetical protein
MRTWFVLVLVAAVATLTFSSGWGAVTKAAKPAAKTAAKPRPRATKAHPKAPAPKPAAPAPKPLVMPPAEPPQEIVAGGMVILRLRAVLAGYTPTDRMTILYNRLNDIVTDRNIHARDCRAVRRGNDWLVMAGPHLFVTATEAEAAMNEATPEQLATMWAANLGRAIEAARPVPIPALGEPKTDH